MGKWTAIGILFIAAIFEAGGDALVRKGLNANGSSRGAYFLAAALILFAYGWTVNAPAWDFGRLLGVYVVFFFVIAQGMAWLVFRQPPSPSTLIGGALILAGGVVIGMANA